MDNDLVIFWCILFYSLVGLWMTLTRVRSGKSGWVVPYLTILIVALFGKLAEQVACIYLAAAMWLTLVLIPGLIGQLYSRRFLQQQYAAAYRLAKVIGWLHPADGWREQPEIVHALDLAQRGELTAAVEVLNRFQDTKSLMGMAAVVNLYRLTNRWEDLIGWQAAHSQDLDPHPQLLPIFLRARGETGDLRGLVEFYDRHKHEIRKLVPPSSRDVCRLMLFAFCGKRNLSESLFGGSLANLPASTREFWLATADLAAGVSESAKHQLEVLLPSADPPLRIAIERRLARALPPPSSWDAAAENTIGSAALEHGHDARFGAQRSLFSKQARATQILIALNILMFIGETNLGGGDNPQALFRLGALYPPAVQAGKWWRLVASLFLHFGALHLAMNMVGLWVLGPFVEFALCFRNFMLVYLLTGIGSIGMVMEFASGANEQQLTVGASGCVYAKLTGLELGRPRDSLHPNIID